MADRRSFVVIGGGLAGAKAVETLRDEGYDGPLVLVCEEQERPYERPPMSKGYLLGKQERDEAFVHSPDWYAEHDVELLLGTRAEQVDIAAREVALSGGRRIPYEKLLLTTGAIPRRLEVPGADLEGVRYLRAIGDSDTLRELLTSGQRVVAIGASFIGLEVTAAAREHGAEVTMVDTVDLPLQPIMGDRVGEVFRGLHADHGVSFRFNTGIERITGTDHVEGVVTTSGETLPADVVVAGIGVTPVIELAESSGLTIDNGISVDASLRTSAPDVFAAGDVANYWHPIYQRHIRVEHWANALNGGPAAAHAMLGQDMTYDRLPYFFSDQYDLGFEYVGWVAPGEQDDVVFRGDVQGRAFHAFWLRGDVVQAGMHVNLWDDGIDPVKEMVGKAVDRKRLADADVPLPDATRS
jgi:3-phenylpropionate/trans-cinnamate dioxygenase ferredoxin reductase component